MSVPRKPRIIVPGLPHHVTQRGNRRKQVFFTKEDRLFFLEKLLKYANRSGTEIASYCLMSNHTHLLVIPHETDSLARTFKPLHLLYSQRLNRRNDTTGLNWQGRFFSSPLDEQHVFAAVQYILLNPVRAKLVKRVDDYFWSSARAHIYGEENSYLTASTEMLEVAKNSALELREGIDSEVRKEQISIISRNTKMNIPSGNSDFIDSLELLTGRTLRYRKRGAQPAEERELIKKKLSLPVKLRKSTKP